jgi:hypothetical protein
MEKKRKITLTHRDSFAVIGKEGSTKMGPGFVERLWNESENHLLEVSPLIKYDGTLPLFWGAMSDFSHSLAPWENHFSEGFYLAGFEFRDDRSAPPEGWVKWDIPSRDYLVLEVGDDYHASFSEGLRLIQENGYALSGAVMDHGEKGKTFLYFPIKEPS